MNTANEINNTKAILFKHKSSDGGCSYSSAKLTTREAAVKELQEWLQSNARDQTEQVMTLPQVHSNFQSVECSVNDTEGYVAYFSWGFENPNVDTEEMSEVDSFVVSVDNKELINTEDEDE